MHTIRTTLIQAFVSIIIIFSASGVIAFGLFNHATSQYQTVLESLVNQSRVISLTTTLINSYKNLTKNVNDTQVQSTYNQVKSDILNKLADKNNQPLTASAKATFSGIDNIIRNIITDTDHGLESVKAGDLTGTSIYYDDANNQLAFLKDLASEHYSQSLTGISESLPTIKTNADSAYLAGIIAGFLALATSLVYALIISRSITKPIIDLSDFAEHITTDDIDTVNVSEIGKTNTEISKLYSSLNLMVSRLRDKITQLDKSKKDIEQRSIDLKRMNDLMTGRELKMIELKGEIESLKEQLPKS